MDTKEFEGYYRAVNILLARKLPGQRESIVSKARPSKRHKVPF
ncbi:hypothetical protein ACFLVD_00430 [Chloroflexota bacterium]